MGHGGREVLILDYFFSYDFVCFLMSDFWRTYGIVTGPHSCYVIGVMAGLVCLWCTAPSLPPYEGMINFYQAAITYENIEYASLAHRTFRMLAIYPSEFHKLDRIVRCM
jgi:hypothetical protein